MIPVNGNTAVSTKMAITLPSRRRGPSRWLNMLSEPFNSPTALGVGAAAAASARPPLPGQPPPLSTKLDTEISVAMAALLLTSLVEAEHEAGCCWLAAAHEAGCCWLAEVEEPEGLSRVEQGDRRRSLVQR